MAEFSGNNFGDREILEDLLAGQQEIAERYSRYACRCGGGLSGELMVLLDEERQMCIELMEELRNRGWRISLPAREEDIQKSREHFSREKP